MQYILYKNTSLKSYAYDLFTGMHIIFIYLI